MLTAVGEAEEPTKAVVVVVFMLAVVALIIAGDHIVALDLTRSAAVVVDPIKVGSNIPIFRYTV